MDHRLDVLGEVHPYRPPEDSFRERHIGLVRLVRERIVKLGMCEITVA